MLAPAAADRQSTRQHKRWTTEEDDALRHAWAVHHNLRKAAIALGLTLGQVSGRAMRLNLHYQATDDVRRLAPDHPAMVGMRTVYPKKVRDADFDAELFKSGRDNRKLGSIISKGPWTGMPIYSLTLEERATCPEDCPVLDLCYGNSLQWSARFRHGAKLEDQIKLQVARLNAKHSDRPGFVIRTHTLGDFYSVEYVRLWAALLKEYPRLRIWGYTARQRSTEIGQALLKLPFRRAAIRFSTTTIGPLNAVTMTRAQAARMDPDEALVCPVETGKTRSCATCGLCWSMEAAMKTIVFILHGNKPGRKKKGAA